MYERLQHAPPARLFHFQWKEHGSPPKAGGRDPPSGEAET